MNLNMQMPINRKITSVLKETVMNIRNPVLVP